MPLVSAEAGSISWFHLQAASVSTRTRVRSDEISRLKDKSGFSSKLIARYLSSVCVTVCPSHSVRARARVCVRVCMCVCFDTHLSILQRCSSKRGTAAVESFTSCLLHSRSAIALPRGLQQKQPKPSPLFRTEPSVCGEAALLWGYWRPNVHASDRTL